MRPYRNEKEYHFPVRASLTVDADGRLRLDVGQTGEFPLETNREPNSVGWFQRNWGDVRLPEGYARTSLPHGMILGVYYEGESERDPSYAVLAPGEHVCRLDWNVNMTVAK